MVHAVHTGDDKAPRQDGFTLRSLQGGAYKFAFAPDEAVLDIYLGNTEAQVTYESHHATPDVLTANTFNFVPPGVAEGMRTVRSGPSVLMTFRPDALRIVPARDQIRAVSDPIWSMVDPAMGGAGIIAYEFLTKQDHSAKPSETQFLCDLLSIRLLQVIAILAQDSKGSENPRFLQKALEYIEAHLGERISLEDVAIHAGVSPFYFARSFRSALGLSLRRYVILRRIEKARVLISSSDRSLAEIAYDVGFSSQSHMTTVFSRFTGRTPSSYRTKVFQHS